MLAFIVDPLDSRFAAVLLIKVHCCLTSELAEDDFTFLSKLLRGQVLGNLKDAQGVVDPAVEVHPLENVRQDLDVIIFEVLRILLAHFPRVERHQCLVQKEDGLLMSVGLKRRCANFLSVEVNSVSLFEVIWQSRYEHFRVRLGQVVYVLAFADPVVWQVLYFVVEVGFVLFLNL